MRCYTRYCTATSATNTAIYLRYLLLDAMPDDGGYHPHGARHALLQNGPPQPQQLHSLGIYGACVRCRNHEISTTIVCFSTSWAPPHPACEYPTTKRQALGYLMVRVSIPAGAMPKRGTFSLALLLQSVVFLHGNTKSK